MQSNYKMRIFVWGSILCIGLGSCSKLVKVGEPVNTITTTETFGSDATATSAVIGIYNDIVTGNAGGGYQLSYGNGLIAINAGMSADELHLFNGPSPFETNTLNIANFDSYDFWQNPYFDVYLANAVIEGSANSTGMSVVARNQLTGEAKFLRAFCYFYLVNLFGDIPLALTTAYAKTDTLSRTPSNLVYQQIIADLQDAAKLLSGDYSISGGARIRVNQSGANALLARVYLYQKQWPQAETAASAVIGNSLYSLVPDLNQVFLANSPEAILQWQLQANMYPYATMEGNTFVPADPSTPPNYFLTDQLLGSFEVGDQRKIAWIDSTNYSGTTYYYPYKYKVMVGSTGPITEYPMILRLAEQYLIRAEARAQQNNLTGAISDLDAIRVRAGLPTLSNSLTQSQILTAVMQERRIELLAEWGHRWLDLKRTDQADAILSPLKPTWQPSAKLYPIPPSEMTNDANLTQNPGY